MRGTTALPANVRANDPTADVASAAQSEISLAALGRDLVISWNDGQVGVGAFQGVATSSNAGASFTDTGVPPAITGGWTYARWVGDPVVAVDESADRFYLAGMAQVDHNSTIIADSCALVVAARFQFFGWTWGPGRVVRALNNTDWLLDKEWIAADSTNGNVYIGPHVDGDPHGRGRMEYPNGDVYEGDFERGLPHGQGRMASRDGVSYVGGWKQGKREGRGTLTWANGDRFEGVFANNEATADGRIVRRAP